MKFKVGSIQPNPFRNMDKYPIRKEKVDALRESLRTTGFWDNVVARVVGGKPQIAYGHHRLIALREEFGPSHEVELIVKELSDTDMLRIMARENMEEWGSSAIVELETIRATVVAYAEGKIELVQIVGDTNKSKLRYAPSFATGDARGAGRERPYTAQTVGEFIGWIRSGGRAQDKVANVLAALELIELGLLRERDFEGLTTKQAEAVVEETRKAKTYREETAKHNRAAAETSKREAEAAEKRRAAAEQERRKKEAEAKVAKDADDRRRAHEAADRAAEREAKEKRAKEAAQIDARKATERAKKLDAETHETASRVGRAVSESIKSGKAGYRQAPQVAFKAQNGKEVRPPPYVEQYVRNISANISPLLDSRFDNRAKKLDQILPYVADIRQDAVADLVLTLRNLIERAQKYLAVLTGKQPAGKTPLALPAPSRGR